MARHLNAIQKRFLSSAYYNSAKAGSLSGFDKFWRAIENLEKAQGIKKSWVKKWLQSQEAYSLHAPVRRKFKRRIVYVESIDKLFEADLVVLADYAKENAGYKYVLVCIDVFSKYAWATPLKTKKPQDVKLALMKIFAERKPISLRTDAGGEFVNSQLQNYLKKEQVNHIITRNETKSNFVERFIRTLKGRLFRYFTKYQSHKYIDQLDKILAGYNNTYHRSIKMTPNNVSEGNEQIVWENLYPSLTKSRFHIKNKMIKKPKRFKFKVGALVRISYLKRVFQRGFNQQWTDEIFKINSRSKTEPYTYNLVDFEGDEIKGTFYELELQKVEQVKNPLYRIEKIVLTRRRRGKAEYLVKWKGWPDKFNSFVTKKDIETYKKSK